MNQLLDTVQRSIKNYTDITAVIPGKVEAPLPAMHCCTSVSGESAGGVTSRLTSEPTYVEIAFQGFTTFSFAGMTAVWHGIST